MTQKQYNSKYWNARLLNDVSKVGTSFGLPPGPIKCGGTCPSATTADPEHICGHCYAQRNMGCVSTVKMGQQRKLAVTKADEFEERMYGELRRKAKRAAYHQPRSVPIYIRLHWSGDFYDLMYIRKWTSIVARLSENAAHPIRIWAPTRTWTSAKFYNALVELANAGDHWVRMIVRPSAIRIGDAPPDMDGLAAGSGVDRVVGNCPAVNNSKWNRMHKRTGVKLPTTCANCHCRVCWDAPDLPVVYLLH